MTPSQLSNELLWSEMAQQKIERQAMCSIVLAPDSAPRNAAASFEAASISKPRPPPMSPPPSDAAASSSKAPPPPPSKASPVASKAPPLPTFKAARRLAPTPIQEIHTDGCPYRIVQCIPCGKQLPQWGMYSHACPANQPIRTLDIDLQNNSPGACDCTQSQAARCRRQQQN